MPSWKRIPTVSDNLSVFANTTSAQLAGVLTNETGTGVFVLATDPALAGNPTATTQSASNNSTRIATTAYVDNQASLGDTSLANTKIWIGTSGGAKAEFALSGDATMTAGGVVSVQTLNQSTNGTAAIATTVTLVDNESTNEANPIWFSAGAAGSGNIGPEADGTLTYNPSTGKITATGFIGAVTGAVSGQATSAIGAIVTDNENANEENAIAFVANAGRSTEVHGLEMDGDLTYNPSSGALTATRFVGSLTGNADTVSTNANLSGDITSSGSNVTAIAADVIINADVKSDAAIAISKTALVAGTGITLSTNTLNVDVAQTQITSVGALTGGSLAAGFTDVPIAQGGTGASTAAAAATALGLGTGSAVTFADLTVSGEFIASSGTITLTGEVAINDQVVILNADAAGDAVNDQDVGFEVERGDSTNAGLKWMETGDETAGSRWEVTMLDDTNDSAYSIPLAVMSDDASKDKARRSVGDGAFYQASGALYCYI